MGDLVSSIGDFYGSNKGWIDTAASAAANMYGANQQANAAQKAGDYSSAAAENATALQRNMYQQNRTDQTPWRETGQTALGYLAGGMGANGTSGNLTRGFTMNDYTADPGYAFRQSEGQKALERSAASRGGLYSGRAAKDLTRFGQDTASSEYNNAYNRFNTTQSNQYNRLASMAGLGQSANAANAASGSNYANQVTGIGSTNAANQGNAALTAANAMASGYTGLGKALGGYSY
jgi:hypothetical protein